MSCRSFRVLVPSRPLALTTEARRVLSGLAARGVEVTYMGQPTVPRWRRRFKAAGDEHLITRSVQRLSTLRTDAVGADMGGRCGLDVLYLPSFDLLAGVPGLVDRAGVPAVASCWGAGLAVERCDPSAVERVEHMSRAVNGLRLVHCSTENAAAELVALGIERSRLRIIHPAVDVDEFRPPPDRRTGEGPLRVIGLGSLSWSADWEHALRAARRMVDEGIAAHLELIGDGPDLQHILYAIDDLDLAGAVTLSRSVPAEDMPGRLRRADVFLQTSCSEGITTAVLQAMAAGLPIVATDAGGMREAVRDGIDGFVIPVRGVEATADALVRLAGAPELRAQMGKSARERVCEQFRLDQQITAFIALFEEVACR